MKLQLYCMLAAVIAFSLQSFLFKKCSRPIFHLLPVIGIVCIYLISFGLFLVDVIEPSGGFLGFKFFSYIITAVNTVALLADGVAWLIEKV